MKARVIGTFRRPDATLALRLALRRIGAMSWLALAALLAAVGLQARTWQQHQVAARWATTTGSMRADPHPAPRTAPADPLQDFLATLARPEDRVALSEAMWQGATRAGLQVTHLEFAEATDAGGLFVRTEVRVPVDGSAWQIRQFAWAMLADHPNLALERLEWRRDAGNGLLHAQLGFTLFSRSAHDA
jgi:hypothetical protein